MIALLQGYLFTSSCVVVIKRVGVVSFTVSTAYRLCANSNDIPLGKRGYIGLVYHVEKSCKR